MRELHYIQAVALLVFFAQVESRSQQSDFGIGMLIPPGGDHMHAVIYATPNVLSDTIAILSEWEYTFHGESEKIRAFLVGFEKYDYWGLPILSITKDSSWAHVSVESSDGLRKTKGWVNLRLPNTSTRIWADFLATQSMVLRRDKPLRFYSNPDTNAIWNIRVAQYPDRDEYSYVLRPIRRQGRWLLVELQTPFGPCGDTPDELEQRFGFRPREVRVWIQYIDETGRPLVQAPMMC